MVDELVGEPLSGVDDAGLEADVVEIRRALDRLEGEFRRRVAEVDRRRSFASRGFLSVTAWLMHACGLSAGAARGEVRMAHLLERMPLTARAGSEGELSSSRVRVLAVAAEAHPERSAEHEEMLVGLAPDLSVRELGLAVGYWRQALDWREAAAAAEALREQRRLHLSRTFDGMVRIDGLLDPESGEMVLTALPPSPRRATARPPPSRERPPPSGGPTGWSSCAGSPSIGERPWWAGSAPTST